jgi:plastocyanin
VRKLIAIALCVAAAAVVAVPPPPASSAVSIRLSSSGFSRGVVSVSRGELIRFSIRMSGRHGVRAQHVPRGAKRFRSGLKRRGGSYSVRLRRRGTYHVICYERCANREMYIRVR